jgi:hypothetical protein
MFKLPSLQELRILMDSISVIDQDLVMQAIRSLVLNTIGAYQTGITVKWNDAELGVYLVYIFGEINKGTGYFDPVVATQLSIYDRSGYERPTSVLPVSRGRQRQEESLGLLNIPSDTARGDAVRPGAV